MAGGSQQQTVFLGAKTSFNAAPLRKKPQSLCGDAEGWGPISSVRYDLTPCFLDVWILFVAAWGVIAGAGALWFLLRKRSPQSVSKNWHFHAKLVELYFSLPASRQLICTRL
jgi:ATP-binding cassette, subfamily C (CFTR/MRP), member 1